MSTKLDNHIYMTIAEICSELYVVTGFSTLEYNLQHFKTLIVNNGYYDDVNFKKYLGIVVKVLNKIYGLNEVKSAEYFFKFLVDGKYVTFGKAAMLLKTYYIQPYGNDSYVKINENTGVISVSI